MPAKATVTLTLRVPPELAERLRVEAAKRDMSVNALAVRLLGGEADPAR